MAGRLLVDVGNTRTKLAVSAPQGPVLQDSWDTGATPRIPRGFDELRVVSVVCREEDLIFAAAAAAGCARRFVLGQSLKCGLTLAYDSLATLGMDRVAAAEAAQRMSSGPVLVLSAGTALTLDAVDESGIFRGGLIAPGRRALAAGLASAAPALPRGEAGADFPARTSASCVGLGLDSAFAGLVHEALRRARTALPGASLWITGGDAEAVAELIGNAARVDPLLVLRGLEFAHEV